MDYGVIIWFDERKGGLEREDVETGSCEAGRRERFRKMDVRAKDARETGIIFRIQCGANRHIVTKEVEENLLHLNKRGWSNTRETL